MMAAASRAPRLIDRLPAVRGRISENAPLAGITWFRVGGAAEIMFRPADEDDLAQFLAGKPDDVPVTVIGVGSNLLVRDGGVPGVVNRLSRGFVEIAAEGTRVVCGAGALDLNVAMTARDAGIAGLEFLVGVPGTIGGGLRMNAGAYGREFKDVVVSARAVDGKGRRLALGPAELGFGYRHAAVAEDVIFTSAEMAGTRDDTLSILINGALDAIYSKPDKYSEDQLIMRPFPQSPSNGKDLAALWDEYRYSMIGLSGIALFIFGNKLDGDNIVNAGGVRREFQIAQEKGVTVIPLGVTGFMAKELADEILADPLKHFPKDPWLELEVTQLADPEADRAKIEQQVLSIIKKLGGQI